MTSPISFSRLYGFRSLLSVAFGVFIASAFFFAAHGASAATITVDSLGNSGGTGCELREAIASAQANNASTTGCIAGAGVDTIVFSTAGTIDLSAGSGTLPTIGSGMSINGGGSIVIDANATFTGANRRILNISAATSVSLSNITLREGRSTGTGGCINEVAGTVLSLTNVSLIQCAAIGLGGAIQHPDGSGTGSITLTNVTLTNNSSTSEGGAISIGDNVGFTAVNLTATGNRAGTPNALQEGAVLYANGFSNNATFISITGTSYFGYNTSSAGAIYIRFNDNHIIDGATFDHNYAGNAAQFSAGNGGALEILGGAAVTIRNSVFQYNESVYFGSGGAIEMNDGNITIEDTLFASNTSPFGGAIHTAEGSLSVTRSTFLNNVATGEGGAIYFSADTVGASGNLTNNTFEGNSASDDGGGAIRNRRGNVIVYNNTFSNNNTIGPGASLLAGDSSGGSTTTFANNIFSNNVSVDGNECAEDLNTTTTSLGTNIFSDATPNCHTIGSDILGTNSQLGSLALNGGVTLSRMPNQGSPAIDIASSLYAPAIDQRSVARPIGVADDAGSIEVPDLTPPTLAQVTPVATTTRDSTPNYTFSTTEAGTIIYGGSCSSGTTSASVGSNTITFNTLADGTYSNCTISVSDASFNTSTALSVRTFTVDTVAPTLTEVTPVPTPTRDTTPNYTFSSTEIGGIVYGGSCSSATTSTTVGSNTITFNALAEGTYSNCTITVSDSAFNTSTALTVSTFTIDTTAPTLAEVTRVPTSTRDTTPNYTFSSTEAGSIIYGGSCSSATGSASSGSNTITFNALAEGTYSNCTITVSDSAFNTSTALTVSTFTIDTTAPTLAEVTRVPTSTRDTTPNYTFSSTEAGSIIYGGSCSSAATSTTGGSKTITLNALAEGTYSDCTVQVSDAAFNTSTALTLSSFIIDTTAPTLAEVTPVPTPSNDQTPNYTFSSTEAGAIIYGGSCSSAATSTSGGSKTITFNSLAEGTYSNCTITVSDSAFNTSTALSVTPFTVDITPPTLLEITPVATTTSDRTPDYVFSSNEVGTISYGGACSSASTAASVGNNTSAFSELSDGTYSDCTVTVTDAAGNASTPLDVSDFIVDATEPVITLLGTTPIEIEVGDTYTDAGATALDARDGDVSADIVTVNNVNTSAAGTYTVTYDVSDELGNPAVQVARTVNVVAAEEQPNTGGGGGGGLGSAGSSALPPLETTFQTSDSGRPQRLEVLQTLNIPVHGLIKLADDGSADTQDDAAVYYVGADGRRHAFPNAAVYFTWYSDFSQVQIVDLTKLASVPLGANVTYKPGVKMVKFATDPKVYAVEKGGVLRWITSEPVAILLYGPMWNMNIDDVNDAFFSNYRFGANINSLSDYNPAAARASVSVPSDSLEM